MLEDFFFPKKESSGGKKAGDKLCNHMILWFHSTEGSSDNKNANTSKKLLRKEIMNLTGKFNMEAQVKQMSPAVQSL